MPSPSLIIVPVKFNGEMNSGERMSEQECSDLLRLIEPSNPLCPWTLGDSALDEAIRHRNQLIVTLMLAYGIRRGDLLKLYTKDALTHASEPSLSICRRPDDPQDPRLREPNAKTRERLLPLTRSLTRLVDDFIVIWRPKFPNAKRTPYLFLSSRDGKPISPRTINATFEALQDTFPGLHPHVCRHTHNNRLRALCTELGIKEDVMKKHAKYLNGWLGDNMDVYTRVEARRQAQLLSKKVQEALFSAQQLAQRNCPTDLCAASI